MDAPPFIRTEGGLEACSGGISLWHRVSLMSESVSVTREISATPEVLWAMIADLPRMGGWSPENTGGRWAGRSDWCSPWSPLPWLPIETVRSRGTCWSPSSIANRAEGSRGVLHRSEFQMPNGSLNSSRTMEPASSPRRGPTSVTGGRCPFPRFFPGSRIGRRTPGMASSARWRTSLLRLSPECRSALG